MTKLISIASSIWVFWKLVRKNWKDAFAARDLARVTKLDTEHCFRIIRCARIEGIEPLYLYTVMNAYSVSIADALKIIRDPNSVW